METTKAARYDVQAQYLRDLLHRRRLSPRELAWRSSILAQQMGSLGSAFTRQAVSSWVNGTRNPRPAHRRILAPILQVPLEDLNRKCGVVEDLRPSPLLREVNVHVYGRDDEAFEYSLTLATVVNLSQPAVYRSWADMFSSPPEPLMRHFRAIKHKLFGWIPDDAGSPLIRRYPCLVPLHSDRLSLESNCINQNKIWFIYSPDRSLQVGFAYRDHNSLILLKGRHAPARKYPLSRIDLVGYVAGNALLQIQPLFDCKISA